MDLTQTTKEKFALIIEEFKKEFAEKESLANIEFDFTYILMMEQINLLGNLKLIMPLIHEFKTKQELTEFTKKMIDLRPDDYFMRYLISYEKLKDDTFKGFFWSVKDYSTNQLESKLYYTDNGKIVYETETTENELILC